MHVRLHPRDFGRSSLPQDSLLLQVMLRQEDRHFFQYHLRLFMYRFLIRERKTRGKGAAEDSAEGKGGQWAGDAFLFGFPSQRRARTTDTTLPSTSAFTFDYGPRSIASAFVDRLT